jgi:hypothetical protein
MSTTGCTYNGGKCHTIIESCGGCNRSAEFSTGWYCTSCPDPAIKWRNGACNLASHVKAASSEGVQKLNPLKASKRGKK